MNRILHSLSAVITLAALIGLLVFVLAPASVFLAFYFLVEAGGRS